MDTQSTYEVFTKLIRDFPQKVAVAMNFSDGKLFIPVEDVGIEAIVYSCFNNEGFFEANDSGNFVVLYSLSDCLKTLEQGIYEDVGFLELDVLKEEIAGFVTSSGVSKRLMKGIHVSDVVVVQQGNSVKILQIIEATARDYARYPETITVVDEGNDDWSVVTEDYGKYSVLPAQTALRITFNLGELEPTQ